MADERTPIRFRGIPAPVERWFEGEYYGVTPPQSSKSLLLAMVGITYVLVSLVVVLVTVLAVDIQPWLPSNELMLAMAAFGVLGLGALGILLGRARRWLRTKSITANAHGIGVSGRCIPWSDVERVHSNLVEWRIPGGDEGGHSRHFEHAVIVEGRQDLQAYFMRSASEAESVAEAVDAFRQQLRRDGQRGQHVSAVSDPAHEHLPAERVALKQSVVVLGNDSRNPRGRGQ